VWLKKGKKKIVFLLKACFFFARRGYFIASVNGMQLLVVKTSFYTPLLPISHREGTI